MKEYLSLRGITFTEKNVAADKEAAREMIQKSRQMGVPVIIIDEQIVVGFNRLKLDELLAAG